MISSKITELEIQTRKPALLSKNMNIIFKFWKQQQLLFSKVLAQNTK